MVIIIINIADAIRGRIICIPFNDVRLLEAR